MQLVQKDANILTIANQRNAALTHDLAEACEESYSLRQRVQVFLGGLRQGATALVGSLGLDLQ